MDALAQFSAKNPWCFETEMVQTTDHLGETAYELYLWNPYAQYSCSPFNQFHYLGDSVSFPISINKGDDSYLMALKCLEMTVAEESYEPSWFFQNEFILKKGRASQ